MKDVTNTKEYQEIQSIIEAGREHSAKAEALRAEIAESVEEQKELMRDEEREKKLAQKEGGASHFANAANTHRRIAELQKKYDELTDQLAVIYQNVDNRKAKIAHLEKLMFQHYIQECEPKRKKMFDLINQAIKVNDELDAYARQHVSLLHFGYSTVTGELHWLLNKSEQITDNQAAWENQRESLKKAIETGVE